MLTIINSDPPTLNKDQWDATFVEFVSACLQKDPKNRFY